jgi:hypothetical protein
MRESVKKIPKGKRAGGIAQMVERLPAYHA